jgi:aromatic ring-opening dioxygenase LigB subunit
VTVVFGAIAPHGDPAFVEGSATRLAFEELGRRLERREPDVTVVFTPHKVASADHAHAHDPEGPFGFDPSAPEYDARVVELVPRTGSVTPSSSSRSSTQQARTAFGSSSSCTARSGMASRPSS